MDGWGLGARILGNHSSMWLLPPNPGPYGTLEQWQVWRQELLRLGVQTPGVDVELDVAEATIAEPQASGGGDAPGDDPRSRELRRIQSEQIGASPITGPEALQRRVEDLLFDVDKMLTAARDKQDPEWWRFADLRDDMVDVLWALTGVRPDAGP